MTWLWTCLIYIVIGLGGLIMLGVIVAFGNLLDRLGHSDKPVGRMIGPTLWRSRNEPELDNPGFRAFLGNLDSCNRRKDARRLPLEWTE